MNFKIWAICILVIGLIPVSAWGAKTEVPKSIEGASVVTEKEAVKMVITDNCLDASASRRCIFVDPRKKKDLKRGIIKGSVLYECKKMENFKPDEFLAAVKKKGYPVNTYDDLKDIDIISGCNGKFCPRSNYLLTALIQHMGDRVASQNVKFYWVRDEGVPGMLKVMK